MLRATVQLYSDWMMYAPSARRSGFATIPIPIGEQLRVSLLYLVPGDAFRLFYPPVLRAHLHAYRLAEV